MGGVIELETVKAVSQSYLTSLWNQDAFRKGKPAALNTLTNQYRQVFTKLVIVIALGAAAYWAVVNPALAAKAFTSVLIVACPCALALAAPFARGTAQRILGPQNVFLKTPDVLEALARVDAVVFDKTGTLTAAGAGSVTWRGVAPALPLNRPSVADVRRRSPASATAFHLLTSAATGLKALTDTEEGWLYSMTRHSTHPLAVRVGEAIANGHFPEPVRTFVETPGSRMEGSVAGHEI